MSSGVKISDLCCLTLEAEIKRLREVGILEWIPYVRPENLADYCVPQEKPEVTLFSRQSSKCW